MPFYRLAKAEDFVNQEQLYAVIPVAIRDMVRKNDRVEETAVTFYQKRTGRSLVESKKDLTDYLQFARAKRDFQNGEMVFTDY